MMRGVRILISRDGGSIRVQLDPPELGTVRIRLDLSEDRARGWVETSSRATHTLLENSIPELRRALENHGIHLETMTVRPDGGDHSNPSDRFGAGPSDREDPKPSAAEGASEATPGPQDLAADEYPHARVFPGGGFWGWDFIA